MEEHLKFLYQVHDKQIRQKRKGNTPSDIITMDNYYLKKSIIWKLWIPIPQRVMREESLNFPFHPGLPLCVSFPSFLSLFFLPHLFHPRIFHLYYVYGYKKKLVEKTKWFSLLKSKMCPYHWSNISFYLSLLCFYCNHFAMIWVHLFVK